MSRAILQDIISDFTTDKFTRFFRQKNRSFVPRTSELEQYEIDQFVDSRQLGAIEISVDEKLLICVFKVRQPLSERSGKRAQYEVGKKVLKDKQADGGIFIFYDDDGNFRFSLIYPETMGNRRQWSNYRRFTYFVSPEFTNKTFLSRIGDGDFSTLEKIKDAFSVEKVTNKFFEEFRNIFEQTKAEFQKTNKNTACLWLKDRYEEKEYDEQINKYAYTFLGRIVFLYFLLRKGWIEGQKNFIRKSIEDPNQSNLYLDFFLPLFFDVFAKKQDDRPKTIQKLYKTTPYLNGGLFEKSELEQEMEKAGIYILFDDQFIRNVILNFFENYSFTIDENSPDDQEVSIDPEMLGKVFENTLAEEERGKKGTFYTPREIVHFMVKEALWQFLKNETDLTHKVLHEFIYNPEYDLEDISKPDLRLIDKKLETVKILDPAVGSAAFPVEMMQVLVNLRKRLDVKVGKNISEVSLKKQYIKNNLYGVDIDSGAIEIAKLRIWLALIVDYELSEIEPLPNLDFQFRVGNSLQEKIDDIDVFNEGVGPQQDLGFFKSQSEYLEMKQSMIEIKDKFYESDNEEVKKELKRQFDHLEHRLIKAALDKYNEDYREQFKNAHLKNMEKKLQETAERAARLEQKIKDGTYKLFKPDFHFSEVFDRKNEKGEPTNGFDIVIGNPPYGVKVENDIRDNHQLGNKDSYGIFISTAFKRFLKPNGILSFIISDTWLTIGTHKALREQVLRKTLHKVVRVNQDCFEATVNACILSATNVENKKNDIIVADLTNISTRKMINELRSKLYHLEESVGEVTPEFAVYSYPQHLIETNTNLPIFVGSPKLFEFMNDTNCKYVERVIGNEKQRTIKVRQIEFNGQTIELARLGDVAEVKQGLATGDNRSYLFQNPEARGSYRDINNYKDYVLHDRDLDKINENDSIRSKLIDNGIHKTEQAKNFDADLWFGGRYIVPYDKGGESDTDTGWLPNYFVPTDFYIDWSQGAVKRLKTLTTKQRNKLRGKSGGDDRLCSRLQNKEFYFKKGITFSWAGVYCPTFRASASHFDHGSSDIFQDDFDQSFALGILCSKLSKFFARCIVNHSINFGVDDVKEIPFPIEGNEKIRNQVEEIRKNQLNSPRYDYMSNKQVEIDKIVYQMYGLNDEDIREIETWYARRYPKLARFCDLDQATDPSLIPDNAPGGKVS